MTSSSEIKKSAVGLILLAGVGVLLFWPMLFEGKVPFDRDFTLVTYPLRHFLHQAYHLQFIPFWNPYVHSGASFLAELHPGVFYPPSLFFFLDNYTTALNLFYVFHFALLGASTFLLMRHWQVSVTGAIASALTAALSGFVFSSMFLSNFFLAIAWFPAVFLGCRQFLIQRTLGWFFLSLFLLASQTLAANPEVSVLTCGIIWLHTVCFLGEKTFGNRIRQTGILVATVILSLGLIAFQLIPTANLVQQTHRSGGVAFEDHAQFSLEWRMLRTFVVPHTHETDLAAPALPQPTGGFLESVYMGAFVPLFLLLAFRFLRDGEIRFWVTLLLVGILLALGKNNFMYAMIYDGVPYLSLFRFPEKYFFISAMASVVLVGRVWDTLAEAMAARKISSRFILVWLWVGFALFGVAALGESFYAPGLTFLLILFFGTVLLMFYYRRIGLRWIQLMFLAALLLDLTANNMGMLPLIDKQYYETRPVLLNELQSKEEHVRLYSGRIRGDANRLLLPNGPTRLGAMIAMKEYMYPFLGMIYGMEFADGVPGLGLGVRDQLLWDQYFRNTSPAKRVRMLARSNVRYWIDVDTPTPYIENYPIVLPDRVKRLGATLPRAFLVQRARHVGPGRIPEIYFSRTFDPLQEVLLSAPVLQAPAGRFVGQVERLVYKPNRVDIETRQEGYGYLVLLDSFAPGWTVQVDGKQGQVLRANHFFRAVRLEPGRHHLVFEYTPVGWSLGLLVSAASMGIMFLASLWVRSLRRPGS